MTQAITQLARTLCPDLVCATVYGTALLLALVFLALGH